MQPTANESYSSVPRRALDLEDYTDIIRRHKAWILGPTFAAMVISVVVAFLWPDTYVSSATIRVVPPTVPESYVPTNINMEMSQRINAMYQTISSRGNLTNIINTFNLYPRERQRKPMEDIVEDMRSDIKIGSVVNLGNNRGVSAFSISFQYDNRIVAQKVTADLVSRFMTENTRENQTASVLTTQFLKDQVDSAKKELDGIEDRLQKFRQDNAGRLPGEVGNNWAQLNALETRIANINGAISRTSQDKLLLEAELRSLKNQMASLNTVPEQITMHTKSESLIMAEREVQLLEAQLSSLRERYRETYPDVQRAQAQLTTARKRRDDLIKEDEQRKSEMKPEQKRRFDPVLARDTQNVQTAIDRIEAQVKQKELQSTEYSRELAQVERLVGEVRAKIASTPVGEKEYAEIVRDREMAKLKYDDLNKKRSQSAIAEELVKRQQGESLEVLDPASLPQTPTQPKRPMIVAIGTGLGFVLGLFFAGAREAKDSSLKNLKDVRAYTQLTILGSVPLLENDLVVRRRRRLAWLAWSTACLVGIMIMTGSVFYYYMTKA